MRSEPTTSMDELQRDNMTEGTIKQETLAGTALTLQDWQKVPSSDSNKICDLDL